MLDKTIDSALQNLRRYLIRSGGEGFYRAEAIMLSSEMSFITGANCRAESELGARYA